MPMKVGDKVRILASPYSQIRIGQIGDVAALKRGGLVRVACDGVDFWFKVELEVANAG